MSENAPQAGVSRGSIGEGPERSTTGMLRREALLDANRQPPAPEPEPRSNKRPLVLAALLVVALGALGAGWWLTRPAPAPVAPVVVEAPSTAPAAPETVDGIPVKPAMGSGAAQTPGPTPAVRLNKPPEQ